MSEQIKLAASIGISNHDFWEMTPAELWLRIEGYNEQQKREQINQVVFANLIREAMWSKTFNPKEIISEIEGDKKKKSTERTPAEQKERFKELDAFFDDWEEKEKKGEIIAKEN